MGTEVATKSAQERLHAIGEAFWGSLFDNKEELRNSVVKKRSKSASQPETSPVEKNTAPSSKLTSKPHGRKKRDQNASSSSSRSPFKQEKQLQSSCTGLTVSEVPVLKETHTPKVTRDRVVREVQSNVETSRKNAKPSPARKRPVTTRPVTTASISTAASPVAARKSGGAFWKGRECEEKAKRETQAEFNAIVRDIRKLTRPTLGKFEQQKIEALELRAAGCKASKRRRMPLPELHARRKAAERSIDKQLEKEKELGVKLFHGKKTLWQAEKEKRELQKRKRLRFEEAQVFGGNGVGYEKNGRLRLSRDMQQKYSISA